MAAMACWTKDTRLGSAIGNIYTRTPTLLRRLPPPCGPAPGRIVMGIGTSSPAIVEVWNGVA
jgi:alkanesulfonate monooxygenase SsuD/methylene tetrahydromethanopterin reductase-like flavin-dependent oxidoreductase (luciferase family)